MKGIEMYRLIIIDKFSKATLFNRVFLSHSDALMKYREAKNLYPEQAYEIKIMEI